MLPRVWGAPRRQCKAHNSLLPGAGSSRASGGVPGVQGQAPERFPSLGAHGSWGISFRVMLVAEFTVA